MAQSTAVRQKLESELSDVKKEKVPVVI